MSITDACIYCCLFLLSFAHSPMPSLSHTLPLTYTALSLTPVHPHSHTCAPSLTHLCTLTHTHLCTLTHTHLCTLTHAPVHPHSRTCAPSLTHLCTLTHTPVHPHSHTCAPSLTHLIPLPILRQHLTRCVVCQSLAPGWKSLARALRVRAP